jgi:DNA repair exonuclease SbcCD nuclease subunit
MFPWLTRQVENRKLDAIFILGDIADKKDKHPNQFINRLVEELRKLSLLASVFLLMGNHDFEKPGAPLLRFLDTPSEPTLRYLREPTKIKMAGLTFHLIPHMKQKDGFWKEVEKAATADFVLLHQTFSGAVAENGMKMQGLSPVGLPEGPIYISGDIHVPQKIGEIIYCGAPHPVRFGDSFKPRVLFWDEDALKSLSRTTIRKPVLIIESEEDLEKMDLSDGDQVRVVLKLDRAQFGSWEERRKTIQERAKKAGWTLAGLELADRSAAQRHRRLSEPTSRPADLLRAFCKAHNIAPELESVGLFLLTDQNA